MGADYPKHHSPERTRKPVQELFWEQFRKRNKTPFGFSMDFIRFDSAVNIGFSYLGKAAEQKKKKKPLRPVIIDGNKY